LAYLAVTSTFSSSTPYDKPEMIDAGGGGVNRPSSGFGVGTATRTVLEAFLAISVSSSVLYHSFYFFVIQDN
jgi:hypothetical protein